MGTTLYDLLAVSAACSEMELRSAYRARVRELHPDAGGHGTARQIATVTDAWKVLSNPETRERYDLSIAASQSASPEDGAHDSDQPFNSPQPSPQSAPSRRHQWVAGVQAQIIRLATLAGRSATQTLLLRHPRGPRSDYDEVVDELVSYLAADTEARVRAARVAGAAPLDLGVGATLVGIRTIADHIRRNAPLGVTTEVLMQAELLDRMWDVLAHELPVQLTSSLGGNPQVSRQMPAA